MSIAAMAAQKRSQMKQTGNLDKLIANRPEKQDLVEKNIIPDQVINFSFLFIYFNYIFLYKK